MEIIPRPQNHVLFRVLDLSFFSETVGLSIYSWEEFHGIRILQLKNMMFLLLLFVKSLVKMYVITMLSEEFQLIQMPHEIFLTWLLAIKAHLPIFWFLCQDRFYTFFTSVSTGASTLSCPTSTLLTLKTQNQISELNQDVVPHARHPPNITQPKSIFNTCTKPSPWICILSSPS